MILSIPIFGIKVPLYETNTGKEAQEIVDAKNSGVIFYWLGYPVIADHASQGGMWKIMYSIPHLTHAYLDEKKYVCVKKQRGLISGTKIYDSNNESIKGKNIELCIYTCTGRIIKGNTEVWLTYWESK